MKTITSYKKQLFVFVPSCLKLVSLRQRGTKNIKIWVAVLCISILSLANANAQRYTDKIVKELQFEKQGSNTLILANINGSMNVQGYEGSKILIEVERIIRAKTTERLEQGKKELQLLHIDRADSLIVYAANGCNRFSHQRKSGKGWNYHWDCNSGDCDTPYDYTVNFSVKVPYGINIEVSTVNDGDITIENVSGEVKANNINGGIKLIALKGATHASTINGDVNLEYIGNPVEDCRYYTLNGDINAWFKKGLTANLSFKSFNGEFYTNVNELESLPALVEKEKSGNGTKFKVSSNQYKISKGGVHLDFETFNGDVYLKER